MPQSLSLTWSVVALAARARVLPAAVLLAFVYVNAARAQAPAAPKEAPAAKAAAEKAAGAGAGSQGANAAKAKEAKAAAESQPAGESGAVGESKGAAASKGAAESKAEVEAGAEVEEAAAEPAAGGVLSIEELRARIGAEKNNAARASMQRELVARLSAEGRQAEVVATLRAMLAEERFDPPFFYNVGNQLARLGESGAAVEAYRKAAGQRHGNYARAQHNLGVVLTRLGRWEEAEAALTAALRLESFTYAEASYNLGRLHALRGEAGLAIDEWTRTLRLKPGHAEAAVALARALAADGDPERGLAVLDSFGERARLRGETAPREVAVARGEIEAAVHLRADAPDGRRGAEGFAARASAAREPAGANIRGPKRSPLRTLFVSGETYEFLRRARAAREAERFADAAALYRDAIRSNGGYFAPANLELGFALTELRRPAEAIEHLRLVVRRSGASYPVAFYHLGRLYEHAGQLAEAGASFARAAELLGDSSPQFFADLSRVREKEGKPAEALAAIESYVRAMERLGDAPPWARERLQRLRQKETPPPAAAK